MTALAVLLLAVAVIGHGALTSERMNDQPAVLTWVTMSGLTVLGAILVAVAVALT